MKFTAVHPLSKSGRVSRSILLVALLIGSLFPTLLGISFTTVAAAITLPVVVYEILRWLPRIHPVALFVLPLFGVFALHMIFVPPATAYGEDKVLKWLTITLMTALAASLLRDEKSIHTFCWAWIVASTGLALVAVTGFQGERAEGFDSNPIWLARAMGTALVMLFWLATQRKVRVPVLLVLSVLLAVGIIATGSRGPILAVGVGAAMVAMFSNRYRIRKVIAILVGAGAAYWAVTVLPFFAESRFVSLLVDGDNDLSRSIFWTVTPGVIKSHPGGVGVGNWSLYAGAPRQFEYPHNLFLEIFSEFGVAIGVAFMVLMVVLGILLLRRGKEAPVAIAVLALLGSETANVFVSGDLNGRTFWFLLTLSFLVAARVVLPGDEASSTTPASTPRATPYRNASSPGVRSAGRPHR